VSELPRTCELRGKAGGTLTAGRSTHYGQVCSEVPYKEIPGPLGWELEVELHPHLLNTPCFGTPARKRAEAPKKNVTTQIQHINETLNKFALTWVDVIIETSRKRVADGKGSVADCELSGVENSNTTARVNIPALHDY